MAVECTIICGSPRSTGVSEQATEYLHERLEALHDDYSCSVLRVAELNIKPCIGCNQCRSTGRCFNHDDMDRVMDVLAHTDMLIVVSPVYFAGPPAQLKALYDRLQPHFWLNTRANPKRPAYLLAVGEGQDPHGYSPLTICTRSALAVAGFKLLDVSDCIGANVRESIDAAFASIDAATAQTRLGDAVDVAMGDSRVEGDR